MHLPTTSRRSLLQGGAAAAIGTLWGTWSQALAAAPPKKNAKAKSVILIFNCGGPSHIDLWDPKPLSADSVRGQFQTIDTAVPGVQVTELIPQLARRADKLAIVRSVHHTQSSHNSGMYWSIVGQ